MTGSRLRVMATEDLGAVEIERLRALMDEAFGSDEEERFTDHDWDHALGGRHFVLDVDGQIVSHAAVVARELQVAGRPLRTGYVEAVATAPDHQRRGHGSRVMDAATDHIRANYELGGLGTDAFAFYEGLGWRRWLGRSFVRTHDGLQATPDEDGYIMVLATPTSGELDWSAPITCDWRAGDVW